MLLGYTAQSAVGNFPIGVSNSVRDSAIAFFNALVSPSSDSKSNSMLWCHLKFDCGLEDTRDGIFQNE